MGVNRIVLDTTEGEQVLIDISDSTIKPETVAEGEKGYGADGELFIGTMTAGEDVTAEVEDYTSKLATLGTAITALEQELEGKAAGGGSGAQYSVDVNSVQIDNINNVYGTIYTHMTQQKNSQGVVEDVVETVVRAYSGQRMTITSERALAGSSIVVITSSQIVTPITVNCSQVTLNQSLGNLYMHSFKVEHNE